MNNNGKIIVAVAAGAVAGAILGILFAPGKGSETRKKIKDKKNKIADDLKEKFNDLKEDIEQTLKEKTKEFA